MIWAIKCENLRACSSKGPVWEENPLPVGNSIKMTRYSMTFHYHCIRHAMIGALAPSPCPLGEEGERERGGKPGGVPRETMDMRSSNDLH